VKQSKKNEIELNDGFGHLTQHQCHHEYFSASLYMPNYRQDRAEAYDSRKPTKERKGVEEGGKMERSEIDKVERVVEEN